MDDRRVECRGPVGNPTISGAPGFSCLHKLHHVGKERILWDDRRADRERSVQIERS